MRYAVSERLNWTMIWGVEGGSRNRIQKKEENLIWIIWMEIVITKTNLAIYRNDLSVMVVALKMMYSIRLYNEQTNKVAIAKRTPEQRTKNFYVFSRTVHCFRILRKSNKDILVECKKNVCAWRPVGSLAPYTVAAGAKFFTCWWLCRRVFIDRSFE